MERIIVTVLPVVFLAVLFGGGAISRRRNIDQDGDPPINRTLFFTSKYLIVAVWAAMVLQAWGIGLPLVEPPRSMQWVAFGLWVAGFALLFTGRLGLGEAFRLGSAQEATPLRTDGLFRISRHPMYLGVFATLAAAVLLTLNPVVLIVAGFVAAVHHKIVLAEERHLRGTFGDAYDAYSSRVRRYL